MPQDLDRTRIHRLLRADLGKVPHWICSHVNGGLSVTDLLPRVIFALGFSSCAALALSIGYWVLPLTILTVIVTITIAREAAELKRVERKCKARLFRHECRYCGSQLEDCNSAIDCEHCVSRNDDCRPE